MPRIITPQRRKFHRLCGLLAVKYLARAEIIVEFDLEDEAALAGEQVRAIETIRRWLSLQG